MNQEGVAARSEVVGEIREHLRRVSLPRLQMLIIVTITGLSGFLASVLLLHLHLRTMWLRYGLCSGLAYLVFFFLLRLWIYAGMGHASEIASLLGDRDVVSDIPDRSGVKQPGNAGWTDWFDFNLLEFDEGLLPIVLIAAIASAVAACGYLIYSAPSLFAEVLLDGVLTAGLYRRMRSLQTRDWRQSVLRRTGVPFAIVTLSFIVVGGISQWYAPEAVSIGGVLRHHSVLQRSEKAPAPRRTD